SVCYCRPYVTRVHLHTVPTRLDSVFGIFLKLQRAQRAWSFARVSDGIIGHLHATTRHLVPGTSHLFSIRPSLRDLGSSASPCATSEAPRGGHLHTSHGTTTRVPTKEF